MNLPAMVSEIRNLCWTQQAYNLSTILSSRSTAKEQLVSWSEVKVNEKGYKDGIRLVLKHKKVQSFIY